MKKIFAFLLLACSFCFSQSQPAGIVFNPAVPLIGVVQGPAYIHNLPLPSLAQGTLLVTYSGVTGAPAGCAWSVYFGGTAMVAGTTNTAATGTVNVVANPSGGVPQFFKLVPSTSPANPAGPFSAVGIAFSCTTFPTAGFAYVEFIPNQTSTPPQFAATHITTNANTVIRTVGTILHSLVINQAGTSETITIYDNTTCATTPIAVLTGFATGQIYTYDAGTAVGLCVATSGTTAGDYTVLSQ